MLPGVGAARGRCCNVYCIGVGAVMYIAYLPLPELCAHCYAYSLNFGFCLSLVCFIFLQKYSKTPARVPRESLTTQPTVGSLVTPRSNHYRVV